MGCHNGSRAVIRFEINGWHLSRPNSEPHLCQGRSTARNSRSPEQLDSSARPAKLPFAAEVRLHWVARSGVRTKRACRTKNGCGGSDIDPRNLLACRDQNSPGTSAVGHNHRLIGIHELQAPDRMRVEEYVSTKSRVDWNRHSLIGQIHDDFQIF